MLGFKGLIIAVFSGARIRPRRFIERTEIYISYDPIEHNSELLTQAFFLEVNYSDVD